MDTLACDFGNTVRAGGHPDPIPVIADSGRAVRVILVSFPAPPSAGDRFTFEGVAWEVVHPQDHVRGCVARPCTGTTRPAGTPGLG